jgi:hypothetical protein
VAIEDNKPIIDPQMTPGFNVMAVCAKLGKASTDIGSQILQSLPGQQPNGGFNPLNTIKCCLANLRVNYHKHCFGTAKKFDKLFFGGEKAIHGLGLQNGLLFAGKKILQFF